MLIKLSIELVPKTCFYSNLRKAVSAKNWDILRKDTYKKANYLCEICGGKGKRHPVDCHEIWEYINDTRVQKLKGLIALCPLCHQAKHLGLSQLRGLYHVVKKHIMTLNNMTEIDFYQYEQEVLNTWKIRSLHPWELDLSWLSSNYKEIEIKGS